MNPSEPNHDYFLSSASEILDHQTCVKTNVITEYERLPPNLDYDSPARVSAEQVGIRDDIIKSCEVHAA